MIRTTVALIIGLLLLPSASAQSQSKRSLPPNSVKLEWTVRQKTDGKLGAGYHVYTLTCVNGRCTLYGVTLNQCDEGRQAAFFPAAEYWDNIPDEFGKSLFEVTFPQDGVVEISLHSWDFGITDTKMRLEYSKKDASGLVAVLTKFSGAVVKNSEILDKVISWELEPVTGRSGLTRVPLSCNYVLVPTVASKK